MRRVTSFVSKNIPEEPNLSIVETELSELVNRAQEILRREITNLMIESTGSKLSPTSSQALIGYIKLLGELKEKEQDELRNLSEEHLKKLSE